MKRHALELFIILAVVAVGAAFLAQHRAEPEDLNAEALYHYTRGVAHARKGEFRQAIGEYSQAIALLPDYLRAYHGRGQAWLASGNRDRAMADYDRGLSRVKGTLDHLMYGKTLNALYLDRARLELVQGDFAAAVEDADAGTGDDLLSSLDVAACAEFGRGQPENAEVRLRTAREYYRQITSLRLAEGDEKMGFLLHLAILEKSLGNAHLAKEVRLQWEREGSPSPHGLEGPCVLCHEP